jgi:signal transduction histidine kinase
MNDPRIGDERSAMSQSKWWRLSQRTRMLLTLELAIALPAAALIGFTLLNLRSIQRERVVEAAIQRDFNGVLKIAEKRIYKKTLELANEVREGLPCTEEPVLPKLDEIVKKHPYVAHLFYFDPDRGLVTRSNPEKMKDPEFRAEADQFGMYMRWLKMEPGAAREYFDKLTKMDVKDNLPFIFYANWPSKGESGFGYQAYVMMRPREVAEGKVALAGFVFDNEYLRDTFFPAALEAVLRDDDPKNEKADHNPAVMMVRNKREDTPLVASAGWDGGKPEVERAFELCFPGLVLAMKFQGTTIEAISDKFLTMNFIVIGGLSAFLAFGVWLTYRNMSREMALAKLKSDFVANVSHELRTPLALIRLYAETLEMGRLSTPEKHQEYYRIIRKESERLSALINNILDFSRIEAGRKEYDLRETNLAELVHQTLESYRYQIEQNGFAFEEKIEEDLPPVRVDREAIARSLVNLINNAIKYSPNEKFLGVKLYRANGDVRLEVIDHGIGIPRGEQGKIFEKFYRAGDPLVHTTKGSGLGLSLVQHIVEAHGGQVSVESVPGKGSRFVIALPTGSGASAHVN